VVALEKFGSEQLLEPLELLAHGCLRQVEKFRRPGHAAGFDDSDERPQ
jgi:hypothetical protein